MKKIFLLIFCLGFLCTGFAQNKELNKADASALLMKNSAATGFTAAQLSDLSVAQSYRNTETGIDYIYLQQNFEGIPVHNGIIVLAFKNGRLASKAGELFPAPASSGNLPAIAPASALNAVQAAAAWVKAKSPAQINFVSGKDDINFGKMGIAYEDITAKQYWLPVNKAGKSSLVRVWQIFLAPINTDDMWQVRVDATTNTVLEKNNLTVYDQFDIPKTTKKTARSNNFPVNHAQQPTGTNPLLVGTVNYLVIPYPVESPLYGPAALVTNPWTMTGAFNANATTLKWHNDNAVDYTISRGNNVWATEDRAGTNNGGTVTPTGLPATSTTTPDPLNFNFPPDYTVAPTNPAFQQFAITNLFYWNNIMHDLSYNYTFDEVSGNFQSNNLGRGGTGNDYVIAIAQSAAGTNNANFSTPADGGRGRMRMYLFTAPNPDRDGDLDAGVMCHEYTHGISNRLTGGIAGAGGCLSNAEEGGEGWSDYFGLMATTDWSTATITDGFNKKRPMGNYVEAQTVNGGGIRTHPYCTNFAINPLTYAFVASSGGEVHDIGEVWAETLWDMTWNIIQMDGINPNLFNAAGTGGNSKALRLVIEGMRLQPCSPGFIDARDAILRADQLLYAGHYHCAILSAFAARGMGTDARQGSSGATNDQTVGFSTIESALTLNASLAQQQEGLQVTYTNHITAGACGAISNYTIRDTLPSNVTYISSTGGTYNTITRVVSFPVNVAAGATVDYPFTVQINAGSYFPTVTLFEDPVPGPTIPAATWSTSTTGASSWTVSTARSHSPTSSYFCAGVPTISDARLFFTNSLALGATPPNLSFWHWYNTESTYDGGILEISTDGGTNYTYVPAANFLKNGYTTTMDASTVLAGQSAWSGNSNGFIKTVVDLTSYANQSIKLRFRNTNDLGTNLEGWYIDDIAVKQQATVDIRSTLFNASNTILQVADTFTVILPPTSTPSITLTSGAGTNNQTVCVNSPITNIVYSTAGGVTNASAANLPAGVTGVYNAGTFTISGTPTATGTFNYTVTTAGGSPNATATGTIIVNSRPGAPTVTSPVVYCQGATASPLTATGTALLWYTVASGGTGSATAPTPSTTTVGSTTYYVSQTTSTCEGPRASITVTINAVPAAPAVTTPVNYCQNAAAVPLTATGTNLLWYTVATGGTGSATAPTPSTTTVGTTTYYVSQTTGTCEGPRAAIVVNVSSSTPAPTVVSPVSYCQNAAAVPLSATGTNLLWYAAATGGVGSAAAPTPSTTTVGSTTYYVSQTSSCGESPRAAIVVNVTAPPAAPTVISPVVYCQNATAIPLTATGTGLLWYTAATGGTGSATAPTPSTTTVGSTTYYVSQTVGCESPRAAIVVTVNATPAAPTVTSPVTYCQGATAVALTATGTNLLWYTAATGGVGSATAPTPSTAAAGSTTYYVSQTTTGCEGPRASILVTVNPSTTAPTVSSPVTYCQGATAVPLSATGTGLLWYTAATGGVGSATAPTPSTATAGSTIYYVSQSGGCGEGPRASITVVVNATPAAPTVSSPVAYCQGATAVPLTATGTNLLWYTTATGGTGNATAPTPSTTTAGSTTYYVSQTASTCEGPRAAIVVNVTALPGAPTVTSPVNYCQGSTTVPLTATGTNLKWYTVATGGTGSATAPTPSSATVGSTTYYVSQATGACEGARAAIVVNVTTGAVITGQPSDITSCATSATFTVTATGTNLSYQWQVSTDGGTTYTNIPGANSATLVLNNLTPAQSNYKYHVVVTAAGCGAVTSNAVSAHVGTAPVVVLTAAPSTVYNPAHNGGVYTTVSPAGNYSYQWTRDGVVLATGAPYITAANGLLYDFGTYSVSVTDVATGCTGLSNSVTIVDVPADRGHLFISPNPTSGIIHVSFYSSTTSVQTRGITVYDDKGARVMTTNFSTTGRYADMTIDLTGKPAGTYMLILRDATGKKIAEGEVVKF